MTWYIPTCFYIDIRQTWWNQKETQREQKVIFKAGEMWRIIGYLLYKWDVSFIFCWLEWAKVINRIFPSHHNKSRCIFLYFTTIWARPAARRERSFISGGSPWCSSHLRYVRVAAELLQKFIFSSDYPQPSLCAFLGEKSWGGKSQCQ